MTEGIVKFFDAAKHFGFINGDDGKSYYVHATQVEQGVRIAEGDKVSFTPAQGDRGPRAEKVSKITAPHGKTTEEVEKEAEEAEETKAEQIEESVDEEIAEEEEQEELEENE